MIRISEIFGPTIQGEGAQIGVPTVFVRTGGCDYRCLWCDTKYAVENRYRQDWRAMSASEVFSEVCALSNNRPVLVTLSGGNPAIQPLGELIVLGQAQGYRFALETQGSIAQDWFAALDMLTLSPKPPSSAEKTDWGKLEACIQAAGTHTQVTLKIVVFDETDYAYAQQVASRYDRLPLYLQPGNHQTDSPVDNEALNARLRWLVEKVTDDNWFSVRVLPQLHVMIWGNERGV
jgi:7-carboxy-7-deazaguanine synthase